MLGIPPTRFTTIDDIWTSSHKGWNPSRPDEISDLFSFLVSGWTKRKTQNNIIKKKNHRSVRAVSLRSLSLGSGRKLKVLRIQLCFVQKNVNFTSEQFTDRETGTHHISLTPVFCIIREAITKISSSPHSRKMTTIYQLRLINNNDSTAPPCVCVKIFWLSSLLISSCALFWNKNPLDFKETPQSHQLFGTFSHRRAGLCTSGSRF